MLLLSIALAIAPCLALGVFIYWRDKFNREPLRLLMVSFFLGAVACIPAALIEIALEELVQPVQYGLLGLFISAFFFVALVEEGWKFFFTEFYGYRKDAFDEPYDGITYAVMVSLGFATLENILYVIQGGVSVALWRMFTAVPAHVTFGVVMGYFMGLAKFKNNSRALKITGLCAAVFLHGLYDFMLFSASQIPLMALGALISLIIGVILSLRAIHLHRKNSPFNPVNGQQNDQNGS